MKIAALQRDIVWEAPETNFERIRPQAKRARDCGAELFVLPEMYSVGFSMEAERIAEPEDGPSTRFLQELAREHGMWTCGSVPVRPEGEKLPYNTLVFAAPDGSLERYRKLHPFTYAKEHEHYGAGTRIVTLDIAGVRVTPFICYDLRFADEFWNAAAGTDVYLVVANWPEKRRDAWSALLLARAHENQAYVVGVNRVGHGNGLDYSGDSAIIDPRGELLVTASRRETLLFADIDPGWVSECRAKFPVLRDRR